jgi:LysR family transcriptional regulator, glycine cleavage system transcriptional activator
MARRLPPLNALVVFEAAARHLSFTRASEELHVTQAAVSHQIKAIEDYLGLALFHRLGRGQGLILTDAGRNYLPRVSAALESIRLATDVLAQVRRKRVLNLIALDSFGAMWLLPRLSRFTRQHPDVDVRITAADVESDGLSRNLADIEIRYGMGNWPQFEVTRFLTESIFPVCSPALMNGPQPLREPQDLRHHTLLHDVMTTSWRDWLTAAGVVGVDAERGPGFNHSNLVIQAVQMGEGVALGRGALVVDALKSGSLVKPFALSLPSPYAYFIVTTKAGAADPLVEACRDWLVTEGQATQRDLDVIVGSEESAQPTA